MEILVLDGGMGTTLQALGQDISSSMWGCELVDKDPDVIRNVHYRYAEAGADLIESATYQLTLPALFEAGYSAVLAQRVLHKALSLASSTSAGAVLSLGPFGATLSPGQEYTGFYPPPYGPQGYVEGTANWNYASTAVRQRYTLALRAFHLDRLQVYSQCPEWASVRWVAFETIPSLAEILGIRLAMAALPATKRRPFWITSAFPNGHHGQLSADGQPVPVAAFVDALLGGADDKLPAPDGLGINCTNPRYIRQLTEEITAAVQAREETDAPPRRPWFVLYPDGGSVYDVVTRAWTDEGRVPPNEWARLVVDVAREALASGCFGGAVVGGCCKSSFDEIAALRQEVDRT